MGKAKKVTYEFIRRESDIGAPMYALLDDLVDEHHEHLREARIALAWCTSWRPDVDGRLTLGKCRKASDLDRELVAWDFIILLNRAFWESLSVTEAQRHALLDHELCHAEVVLDGDDPKVDERGRVVYRIRKHDLEEFTAIVERHGTYKRDLELFAQALVRHQPERRAAVREEAKALIANCPDCDGSQYRRVVTEDGVEKVTRCHCFQEARRLLETAATTL